MSRPWRSSPPPPHLSPLDGLLQVVAPFLPLVHPRLTEALWGAPPRNDRDIPLDDQTHLILGLDGATSPTHQSVPFRRQKLRRSVALIDGPRIPVYSLVETLLDRTLRARIYRPSPTPNLPWMLYIHGGGWVTGDLESHDRICRRLCHEGELVVVSVDYRLAPEAPFPAAVSDIEQAWTVLSNTISRWGGHPDRGSVGGDSAGGNLAAVLCQRLRDGLCTGVTPKMQLLIYPVIDFRRLDPSHRTFAEGFLLTSESIDYYKALYAAPDDNDPAVSPIRHDDLSQLPPAIVVTAGFDPLRDEGERYVHALRQAGTPAGWVQGEGLVHGFVQMDCVVPAAGAVVDEVIRTTTEMVRTGTVPPALLRADPPSRSL